MAQTTWEKPRTSDAVATVRQGKRWLFLFGGFALIGAIVLLIIGSMTSGAQYYMTIDNLLKGSYVGQTVRISGAVIGDSIKYDGKNLIIDFTVVNVPDTGPDLAAALHNALQDPKAARLKIHVENQVKPDLLQNEAQAIVTGKLGTDGVFYASELLLKCPSRYQDANPGQNIADPSQK